MPLTLKNFNKTTPPIIPLNFTANTWGSTVKLSKNWSPTAVTIETSTDWTNWSTYTFGTDITLTNIGDKVYFRNTSKTDTRFNLWNADRYYFWMSWSIAASWDISTLLNKNWTTTASSQCFNQLFVSCSSLTSTPSMPFTTLVDWCFNYMFIWCSNLVTLPSLKTLTLPGFCYRWMFFNCSKIKISASKTWEYQTEYRIPISWTWTEWSSSLSTMFTWTWWTYTSDPVINTTYYTSNTVI